VALADGDAAGEVVGVRLCDGDALADGDAFGEGSTDGETDGDGEGLIVGISVGSKVGGGAVIGVTGVAPYFAFKAHTSAATSATTTRKSTTIIARSRAT
jgi:hypothetical protein